MLTYITALTFFFLGYGVGVRLRLRDLRKNLTENIEKLKKPSGKVFSPLKKKEKEDFFKL